MSEKIIAIEQLKNICSDITERQKKFSSAHTAILDTYFFTCDDEYINAMKKSIFEYYEKIDDGYKNVVSWFTDYNSNVEALENSLSGSGTSSSISDSNTKSVVDSLPDLNQYDNSIDYSKKSYQIISGSDKIYISNADQFVKTWLKFDKNFKIIQSDDTSNSIMADILNTNYGNEYVQHANEQGWDVKAQCTTVAFWAYYRYYGEIPNMGGYTPNGCQVVNYLVENSNNNFTKETDINAVKPGTVISFYSAGQNAPGHVAFINDVSRDADGNITDLWVTDGNSTYSDGNGNFDYSNNNSYTKIWCHYTIDEYNKVFYNDNHFISTEYAVPTN